MAPSTDPHTVIAAHRRGGRLPLAALSSTNRAWFDPAIASAGGKPGEDERRRQRPTQREGVADELVGVVGGCGQVQGRFVRQNTAVYLIAGLPRNRRQAARPGVPTAVSWMRRRPDCLARYMATSAARSRLS